MGNFNSMKVQKKLIIIMVGLTVLSNLLVVGGLLICGLKRGPAMGTPNFVSIHPSVVEI